jgi:hypothetical protein
VIALLYLPNLEISSKVLLKVKAERMNIIFSRSEGTGFDSSPGTHPSIMIFSLFSPVYWSK